MQKHRTPAGTASAWGAAVRDPVTHAIVALGFTQIIAWGTTLYALGVLGKPIAADTGVKLAMIFHRFDAYAWIIGPRCVIAMA